MISHYLSGEYKNSFVKHGRNFVVKYGGDSLV